MTRIDRLSALDAAFLALDSHAAPLHVGWTMRFDGPVVGLAQLRRHLDARLAYVPRFRRRVVVPPLGLGDPRWADDRGFDIARHVHQVTLEAPGGGGELRQLAGMLLSTPLDPSRPLWRLYLVDGLASGGFALVGQAHHALVDGIAAIEVATLLFAPEPPAGQGAGEWRPSAAPGVPAATRDAVALRARGSLGIARSAARRMGARPGRDAVQSAAGAIRDAAGALDALARPTPHTGLQRSASPRRAVAYADVSLDAVRSAGRRHQATINDVLLAACTLALGRALRRRGDHPQSVKILVPVNTRGDDPAAGLANKISFMAVELPAAEIDPVRVLRTVRNRTRIAKGAGTSGPVDNVMRAADLLPSALQGHAARVAWQAASFTAIVSNVPGPPVELSLLGRALRSVHPAVPVPEGHALSIGALSYGERLHVGLYADAVVVPDAVDIARDLEGAFDVLRVEAGQAPTPWRAKARAKREHLRVVK